MSVDVLYPISSFSRFCRVVEAIHGQEALDIINAGVRPDLIISDIMMPSKIYMSLIVLIIIIFYSYGRIWTYKISTRKARYE